MQVCNTSIIVVEDILLAGNLLGQIKSYDLKTSLQLLEDKNAFYIKPFFTLNLAGEMIMQMESSSQYLFVGTGQLKVYAFDLKEILKCLKEGLSDIMPLKQFHIDTFGSSKFSLYSEDEVIYQGNQNKFSSFNIKNHSEQTLIQTIHPILHFDSSNG